MATTEEDTQATPASTPLKDIILADDGDVILIIKKRQRVLTLGSPVFRQMLGPHFLEGQTPRSAEQPVEIQLPEDGIEVMTELLIWMHLGNIDTERQNWNPVIVTLMAAHIDKYACGPAQRLVAEALLERQLETYDSRTNDTEMFAILAWTAKAAYLLGASDLFTRCTRRLVLVGILPYSDIPDLASDVDITNKEILPVTVLWMEEQRSTARHSLLRQINSISEGCVFSDCDVAASTSTFSQKMAHTQTVNRWPPLWEDTSIRCALQGLEGGGDISFKQKVNCSHTPCTRVLRGALSDICKLVEEEIHGMCYVCARQDKMQSMCEHKEKLKKVAAHPLFV
ncbi:hypothetical protein LTR27_010006 [Elasticomyces elasticus]|nr:hypothetical protein LTR27_010006 [Elasticomyces elasticus]